MIYRVLFTFLSNSLHSGAFDILIAMSVANNAKLCIFEQLLARVSKGNIL